jgi:hypothetical protein
MEAAGIQRGVSCDPTWKQLLSSMGAAVIQHGGSWSNYSLEAAVIQHGSRCNLTCKDAAVTNIAAAVIQHSSRCNLTWKQLWSNMEAAVIKLGSSCDPTLRLITLSLTQLHAKRTLVAGQPYLANQYLVVASSASYWSIRRQLRLSSDPYWFKAPSCDQNTIDSQLVGPLAWQWKRQWTIGLKDWRLRPWILLVKLRQLFRAGIQVQSPCLIFAVCPSSEGERVSHFL